MTTPASPPGPKTFRFALYGRTEAGKTCYLTALAMDHVANPRGYSTLYLSSPDDCPRPPPGEKAAAEWLDKSPDASLHKGRVWLEKAIEAIIAGRLPKSTDLTAGTLRYRFVFRGPEFTPPESEGHAKKPLHRNYRVELIDYSGELIDPDLSGEDLARMVKGHLQRMDGLIVLAEAPRANQSLVVLGETLRRLRVAFEAIRAAREDLNDFCPIALVFNKWDRRVSEFEYDPRASDRQVEEFLVSRPEPPHKALRFDLESAVGPENFAKFVASAFGRHAMISVRTDSGNLVEQERPVIDGRLASYGLEDPFMWLAKRREDMLISRVEAHVGPMTAWKVWQRFGAAKRDAELNRRIEHLAIVAKDSPAIRDRLAELRLRARKARAGQAALGTSIATFALVLASFVGVNWAKLAENRRTHAAIAHRPESLPPAKAADSPTTGDQAERLRADRARRQQDADALFGAQEWYARYAQTSWAQIGSHLFYLSVGDARKRLAAIRRSQADVAGELRSFDRLIAAWEKSEQDHQAVIAQLQAQADAIGKDIAGTHSRADLDRVRTRIERFEGVRDKFAGPRKAHAEGLKTQLAAQERKFLAADGIQTVQRAFNNACELRDVVRAAETLVNAQANLDATYREDFNKLWRHLEAHGATLVKAKVQDLVDRKSWREARRELDRATHSAAVAQVLGAEAVSKLAQADGALIVSPQRRYYYKEVQRLKTTQTCADFLNKDLVEQVPDRAKAAVQRYASYLGELKARKSYEIVVEKIYWGSIRTQGRVYGSYEYPLSIDAVEAGGTKSVLNRMTIKGSASRSQDLGFSGQLPEMTPDSPVSLQLTLFFDGSPYQEARLESRLNNLRESTDVELSNGSMQAKVTLRVKDLPTEPKLDDYDGLVVGP